MKTPNEWINVLETWDPPFTRTSWGNIIHMAQQEAHEEGLRKGRLITEAPAIAELISVPMIIHCPDCRSRHIDEGEFATKPHHTHACQSCGLVWRPAIVHTVGVRFLPGFKNGPLRLVCRGCDRDLLPENYRIADGCPCNSRRGINHGIVAKDTCTCVECDPAQTGSTRCPAITERVAPEVK